MRSLLVALAVFIATGLMNPSAAEPAKAALQIKPARTAIFDFDISNGKVVAVGERGIVLHSSDYGITWSAVNSATNRSLTSIAFLSEKVAVAAGHGATLMRTEDAGATWKSVRVPEIGTDSVLGLLARKNGRVVAYGAFGMYIESADSGKTWKKLNVVDKDFDRHISQVIEFKNQLFLVGESGTVAMSADDGATWERIQTPYTGSFFGALAMPDGALLIYGMRGNIFRSVDAGKTWTNININSTSAINGGWADEVGNVVLVGNNGLVAVSKDHGRSFKTGHAPEGLPLARGRLLTDGSVLYVGYLSTGIMKTPAQ